MSNYSIVLVAVDLREGSAAVLDGVRRLGRGTAVHLVHVAEHPLTGLGDGMARHHIRRERDVRQNVYPELQRLAEGLALPPDHLHILFGDPPSEIVYLARKLCADLIVTGRHGESALRRLLGSTVSRTLQEASCDVLTVRIPNPE